MFCLNCGKEIEDNAVVCEHCGTDLAEAEKQALKKEKATKNFTVKDFILKIGRILVDVDTYVGITLAVLILILCWVTIVLAFLPDKTGYFEAIQAVPALVILSFVLPVIIIFFVVITKYLIYLLIDIRDSLREIKEQRKEGIND